MVIMIFIITMSVFLTSFFSRANNWTYQVNINNKKSLVREIFYGKVSFEAGPYVCEVSPISIADNTEYRTLTCSIGTSTVSTGGLCTRKNHKFPSVQYAILNITGAKTFVNVNVACNFESMKTK